MAFLLGEFEDREEMSSEFLATIVSLIARCAVLGSH